MNTLDPKHKNTFLLIDNKSNYLFSLNDLISIIETAIGNAPDFFSEPLEPLNPYNKQPFTQATLYNIYFKMKESNRIISILFHFFFLENFCSCKFSEHYEHHIRENAIKKYIFNSPYTVLYPFIFIMLESNPHTANYKIHKDFPKEILVNIFRPFLFYYFIINYDIKGTNKIYTYKDLLYRKLKKFYQYNKAFGRRYIQVTKHFNKVIKKEYKFNTNHISFYGIYSNDDNNNNNNNYNNNNYNQILPTTPIFNNDINYNPILNSFNTTIFNIYDSDATITDESNTHNTESISDNENSTSENTMEQEELREFIHNINNNDEQDNNEDDEEYYEQDNDSIS